MARLTCNTRFYRYYSSNSNSNSRRKRLLPHGCGIAIAAFPFVKCEENDNENPDNIEIDLLAEAKVVVSDVELHIAAERGDITAVRCAFHQQKRVEPFFDICMTTFFFAIGKN